ncbi:MAG: response regulator [Candidatus Hydrogenedentes bacterium]|nr:response regulator [Candidatus Hydrogenedentota bacterium]
MKSNDERPHYMMRLSERQYWVSSLVLGIGLVSTAMVTIYVWRTSVAKDAQQFETLTRETRDAVNKRLDTFLVLMNATAGLFTADLQLGAKGFREYVKRLNLPAQYPGISGIGYVAREAGSAPEATPAGSAGEAAPVRYPVRYFEAQDGIHGHLLGFDMYSHPDLRQSMVAARDSGEPSVSPLLSGQVPVAADGSLMVMFVPVYEGMPGTVEGRRERIQGFVYSIIQPADFLQGLLMVQGSSLVDLAVYASADPAPEQRLFSWNPGGDGEGGSQRFEGVQTLEVGQQPWLIVYRSNHLFEEASQRSNASYALLAGLLISLFLSRLSWSQARARDMAERSREALGESEERFRTMADNAPVMIYMADASGDYVYVSRQWMEFTGRRFEDGRGRGWFESIHDEDRPRVRQTLKDAVGSHEGFRLDYRILRHDGVYRWMIDTATSRFSSRGMFLGYIGSIVDITDHKEAEEQLRRLNETLEQRVADRTVEAEQRAYELRRLAAELTQAEQRERRRIAQVLHDEVQQLLVAAKMRISTLVRVESDGLAEAAQQADELIGEVIQLARSLSVDLSPPMLRDRGLGHALEWLARRVEQELGLIIAVDADFDVSPENEATGMFLLQATRELLLNAVKHSGAREAQVMLRSVKDGQIEVCVEDEGEGFDPALLEEVYEPEHFGLFSIKQRLDLLGGEFEIHSEKGAGTRVILRVPMHPPEGAGAELEKPAVIVLPAVGDTGEAVAKRMPGARRIRVLLVDDHKIVRQGLAGLIEDEEDLQLVGEASDGAMAVEMVRSLHPDVVVMDISMPRMNGIEATRRISREFEDVRVVGLSMHEAADVTTAMEEAGASAYISKDGPSEELLAAIRGNGRG